MRHKRPTNRTFDRPFWSPEPDARPPRAAVAGRDGSPPDTHGRAPETYGPATPRLMDADGIALDSDPRPEGSPLTASHRGRLGARRRVRPLLVMVAGSAFLVSTVLKPWVIAGPPPIANQAAPSQAVEAAQGQPSNPPDSSPADAQATDPAAAPSPLDQIWAVIPGVAQDAVPTAAPTEPAAHEYPPSQVIPAP